MKKLLVFITTSLILAIAGGVFYLTRRDDELKDNMPTLIPLTFEECISLGHPTLETYPRQCTTPEGDIITEVITIPDLPKGTYVSAKGVSVTVSIPEHSSIVVSPLKVVGTVPGNWSSEASFPVVLEDLEGNVLSQTTARLSGDWMTDADVPFEATLDYVSPGKGIGKLVLKNANPSGLPENEDRIEIPVTFPE